MLKKTSLLTLLSLLLVAPVHASISRLSFETRGALFFYMGENQFATVGEPIPFVNDPQAGCFKVARPGTCRSSTIGFLGAGINYRIFDRLSMKLGSYMGYGSIEYETQAECDQVNERFMVASSLKCHLPILIGPYYEFYSSDSASLGASLGVGASIWSVRSGIKVLDKVDSSSTPWSDFKTSFAGTAGLDLALKVSEIAHLKFAFAYSLLGNPGIEALTVKFLRIGDFEKKKQKFEPGFIHGLNGAIGISFKF